jgi:hypothetical protein
MLRYSNMNRVFKDLVPVLYKRFHNLACPLTYSFPMLPRYASNYKVTRLAQRKPEAPFRTYQYHAEVPQSKTKETRLTGESHLHNTGSFMRRTLRSLRQGLHQRCKTRDTTYNTTNSVLYRPTRQTATWQTATQAVFHVAPHVVRFWCRPCWS